MVKTLTFKSIDDKKSRLVIHNEIFRVLLSKKIYAQAEALSIWPRYDTKTNAKRFKGFTKEKAQ